MASVREKLRKKYQEKHGNVDNNYINTFLSEASAFLQGSESAYNSMNFDNQDDVYKSWHERSNELRSRSYKIRRYLERNKSRYDEESYNSIMSSAYDGAIILCHDLHGTTVDAMERVIPDLQKKGYQLVTVSQLYAMRGYEISAGNVYYSAKKIT